MQIEIDLAIESRSSKEMQLNSYKQINANNESNVNPLKFLVKI